MLVKSGCLELEVGETDYLLSEGDAISFVASSEHTYRSTGNEKMEAVIINDYMNR